MAKKFLSILLALVLVLGLMPAAGATAAATSPTFSDMPDNWATEALESAVANGLLIGDDGKIMPDSPLTRAQMATVVARAFGAIEEGDISEYTDVKSTDWFAGSIAKAYKMGIMHGYAGKMDPDDNITREQAFALLARALKLEPASGINKTFEDVDEISDWAKGEVYALVNAGYIQGSNGKLNPQANISRAEFAQMMHNLIKQYIKAEGEYTEVADGNIMVNVPGVTLKNVTINGDLIIGDGVGEGDLTLDNVVVKGRMLVRGGGIESIVIVGGGVEGKVIVAKADGNVRVVVDGADVEVVVIDDGKNEVVIEGTVGAVDINASDVPVAIRGGKVGEVKVSCEGSAVITVADDAEVGSIAVADSAEGTSIFVKGSVAEIETSAANTMVYGSGEVGTVSVGSTADNTSVTTPNTVINNGGASGVTAAGGKEVPVVGSVQNNATGTNIVTSPAPSDGGETGTTPTPTPTPQPQPIPQVPAGPVVVPVYGVRIEGTPKFDQVLTAVVNPSSATVKYQWLRSDDGVNFEEIEGATGRTYTLTEEDVGKYIKVKVTGVQFYFGTAESTSFGPVTASTYKFSYEVPDKVFAGESYTVPVTIEPETVGDVGYERVRFDVEVTTPEGATLQLLATDTNGVVHDVAQIGYWGPENGFPIGPDYKATTTFTAIFSAEGEYTITFSLVDLDFDRALVTQVVEVTVWPPVVNVTRNIGYNTIEDAIVAAQEGDTILVAPGTYNVTEMEITTNGITLKSTEDAEKTIIAGGIELRGNDITIDGFTIGTDTTNGFIGVEGTNGCTITNNIVNGAKATVAIGNTTGNTVGSITIESNKLNGGAIGLYPAFNSVITIKDNIIDKAPAEGIWLWGAGQKFEMYELIMTGNSISGFNTGEYDGVSEVKLVTNPRKSVNGETDELLFEEALIKSNSDIETIAMEWIKAEPVEPNIVGAQGGGGNNRIYFEHKLQDGKITWDLSKYTIEELNGVAVDQNEGFVWTFATVRYAGTHTNNPRLYLKNDYTSNPGAFVSDYISYHEEAKKGINHEDSYTYNGEFYVLLGGRIEEDGTYKFVPIDGGKIETRRIIWYDESYNITRIEEFDIEIIGQPKEDDNGVDNNVNMFPDYTNEGIITHCKDKEEIEELDLTLLDAAIEEAIATKEGIVISEEGADVPAGTYWVTQMDMDALDAAIANAEAAKESAETQQDVAEAVEALEAAVSTFNGAKQKAIDEEEIEESGQGEEPEE